MPALNDELTAFVKRHSKQGILLDTNVLLLFIIAKHQPTMIGKKRLEKYGEDDGKLLVNYINKFSRILTTPHVLAETSNLVRQIVKGSLGTDLSTILHPLFCLSNHNSFKQFTVNGNRIDSKLFGKLGLTDSGLATLVPDKILLLTDDLNLYVAASMLKGDAINFTHMREAAGIV